jgi:hypothetical protein
VLHYLKESDKEYRIRALTRDASKPKAKALAELGAEVISVDLRPENKEDIIKAYKGADVVFVSITLGLSCARTHAVFAGCNELLGTRRQAESEYASTCRGLADGGPCSSGDR